jgi:phage baseplate assembly protein W
MSKKSFLGTGWSFPIRIGGNGGVALSSYEENIEESIRVILGTALGERVMLPDFGAHIHDYVFHPNNPNTAALVSNCAQDALAKHEARIDDIDVRAYPDPSNDNTLILSINYKIAHDNNLRNMVYPFYLRREQDYDS